MILVGKIIGQHGINGVLRVYSYTESLSAYNLFSEFLVDIPSSDTLVTMKLLWFKLYKKGIRLKIGGIDDRCEAKSLLGSNLYVKKSVFPPLDKNTYFWSDLLNITVKSICGREIGRLDSIISTGSNDVYVVKSNKNQSDIEILIPAIRSVVVNVDLGSGVLFVDLPDGLE